MTDPKLNYLGPLPKALPSSARARPWWRRLPTAFLGVVVAPTTLAAAYYFLIASPLYVSEARFVVRVANQAQPSSLGVALQGVGLSSGLTDAFVVHEYIRSRDGVNELKSRFDLEQILNPAKADFLSRGSRPWQGRSDEELYKGLQRFVVVGYDATTGISTLRVQAFNAADAQKLADAMLVSGENLVNRLNERASNDAVEDAQVARDNARNHLASVQQQLTAFRNREEFIDPARVAVESSQLIGGLLTTIATLKAERAQLAAEAPSSPQLPIIDSRIAAYERQVAAERAKIAGDAGSLAPKIGAYEDLVMEQEFASKELAVASSALVNAEQQARRQKLYLDRIVAPSLPDKATKPARWRAVFIVFLTTLLAYGIGWLIWAGVREHRQD